MIRENGEFVMESFDGVSSWLIWIHFLVMFLLMIVLIYLTIISVSDKSTNTTSSSSPPPPSSLVQNQISSAAQKKKKNHHNNGSITNCSSQHIQVNEDRTENQSSSRRTGIIRPSDTVAQVNRIETVTPTPTTTTTSTPYCSAYNPCHLLELGRRAFLKCLGLDDSTASQDCSLPNGTTGQGKLRKRDKSQ